MGKARRLKRQQAGGEAPPKQKEQGEAFYAKPQLDVLPADKEKKEIKKEPVAKERSLTARQKKRLEKVLERKEKNAARASLLADLQKVALPPSQAQYLLSTAQLGTQRTTAKQQLHSDLLATRVGLPVSEDSRLLRPVQTQADKDQDEAQAPAKRPKKKPRLDTSEGQADTGKARASGFLAFALGAMKERGGAVPASARGPTATPRTGSDIESGSEEEATKAPAPPPVPAMQPPRQPPTKQAQQQPPKATPQPPKPAPAPSTAKAAAKEAAVYVTVKRSPEVQAARLALPILGEEQAIMEAVRAQEIVLLCGETGSGKTTQLPQFLYEAGFASGKGQFPGAIAITEPRRVAAISMSKRVGEELGDPGLVSYQIRYAGTVTGRTRIKYMTDGVLLKELERDFLLRKYSAIIIDEAHERSLNTDILIGMLSRLVPMRNQMAREPNPTVGPLRLVIMSATLRVEDFTSNTRLFPTPPPVLQVASRQHPVTIHFNKHTPHNDYLNEAYRKTCKVHQRLPPGGILVFVTSQQEVSWLCRRLRRRFPRRAQGGEQQPEVDLGRYPTRPTEGHEGEGEQVWDVEEAEAQAEEMEGEGVLSEDEGEEGGAALGGDTDSTPLHVLPLYSLLPQNLQMRVFAPPPPGTRLCVVATNVAETSLTIPDIRYVIDTGKVKAKHHDTKACLSRFEIEWVSQASADQRAGRAGRTGPGHCYRLYSSAVFANYMETFADPEVLRLPIEGLVLQMKAMGIDNVVNFPFPTPPDSTALRDADELLKALGAVDDKGHITPLGRTMAKFPVSPRYSRMLVEAHQLGCLHYAVALAAALTVGTLFDDAQRGGSGGEEEEEEGTMMKERARAVRAAMQKWVGSQPRSDLLVLLKAVGAFEYAGGTEEFCTANHLRYKSMVEVRKLRRQLGMVASAVYPDSQCSLDQNMKPPGPSTQKALWQVVLAGYGGQVARRVTLKGGTDEELRARRGAYECEAVDGLVYIHPQSCLASTLPELVVYTEIALGLRPLMKGVTGIKAEWLPVMAPALCTFGQPVDNPAPYYDQEADSVMCSMASTYGRRVAWPLPVVRREYPADNADRYKYFAMALLEGKVCPVLSCLVPHLVSAPALLRKATAQEKIVALLAPLAEAGIASRQALVARWAQQPTFLLAPYSLWVQPQHRNALQAMWPPIAPAKQQQRAKAVLVPDQPEVATDSEDSD